ncbi:MAG: glycosyltransferase [Anaeromyxobacter sp.]|nr:glycosyltransferase [Anaeromyxobacter sp.]
MRVGYLVSQYPAPSHTFIRREVAALRRLSVEVETFSIRPGHCLSEEDRAEAARTFTVLPGSAVALAWPALAALVRRPARWLSALEVALRHSPPGALARARALVHFAEGLRLALEAERRGVRHLHCHFANPASVAGLAASRWLGVGWSVTLHGLSDFAGPTTPQLGGKVAEAEFVASATEWGRGRLRELGVTVRPGQVHVIRCGVEVARLPAPARRQPTAGEPLVVLAVGRLSPEKGHVGLVTAFAELRRRGVDARLVLVGGGPEEGAIRAAVALHGLEGCVELRGPLPEPLVLEAMARAHVFALSSLMEGLPVVLMEALALELPVVAPALAGILELVAHGETGLLYPEGTWMALADGLERLARDLDLRVRLGAAGRALVVRDFDAQRAAIPLARLFRALPAPERAAPAR